MLTITVSSVLNVCLYDSIKELPARLYQLARQYEVMASELGQNEAEQGDMLVKAEQYALAGKIPDFQEQMRNYRLARYLTKQSFQAGQLDWACRVCSVNGIPVVDYSEDALRAKVVEWSEMGLTQQLIEESLDDVKKKGGLN